jgi:hypothetical protein
VAVDHQLLDLGVGEQLLERAEPDGVAQDQLADLLPARLGEDRRRLVDQLAHRRLEVDRRRVPCRSLGAPTLDQAHPQLGRDYACVVVERCHLHK